MHLSTALSLALIWCALAAGCLPSNRVPMKIYYYTLAYQPLQVELKPTNAAILVEHLSEAPGCNTDSMVYEPASNQLSEYAYHRWRATPGSLVASFILRDIRRSGLFRAAVDQMDLRTPASYRLTGSVDEFFEQRGANGCSSVAVVTVSLLKENELDAVKRLLFQKTYREAIACEAQGHLAVAKAMSVAVSEISRRLIVDINQAIN